ncbi:DNA internalization-related competence protein ComEC/Rec2 [Halomonas korlensis]|uniref:Competence protein ComEC n=1 Tax=Halomonas korlensis TaxID=463301 RepID=A0A1I7JYM0_9GAMM|nr:DNA internalization-related competence protein ComEC/Rec2 [Halomonas korlensis]SFU90264.1 competence protein ComEC [Halomonas korlensis]
MRLGLAIPLAIAALAGAGLGHLAPPGLLEALAVAMLVAVASGRPVHMIAVGVVGGVAIALLLAKGAELADGLAGEDLAMQGQVLSVSREQAPLTRLTLSVEACEPLADTRPSCERLRRVRLSAYDAPPIERGERWAFTVRLRPPSGFANPHAFDYRAWLWREGIQATGYVRREPAAQRLEAADVSLRQSALDHLDAQELSPRSARWLAALTLGASERLVQEDWDLLNASGTTHLMVISGLHVGLMATFALLIGRGAARLITPGRWGLAVWPWWFAAASALGYAWLAGLEPPALRALVMTLVGLWVASGRHSPGPWQAWWLALALVLLIDPLSVWRPGLWLSFGAVSLLILIWQGRAKPRGVSGWLWALLRTQVMLAPLMAAAVLLSSERLAPAAPLVNLVAVPLVSSLMVPLGLLGWLFAWAPPLADACWWLFAWLTEALAWGLEQAVAWLPLWLPEPSQVVPLALALGGISLLWALPGVGQQLRLAGSILLPLLPLTAVPEAIEPGQVRVRVHDVGQGQLIELRTTGYRALVDTGPRFTSGFAPLDTLWAGRQRFDEVIVSHDDLDHAGGVASLVESHHVERFRSPIADTFGTPSLACRAGDAWQRDGVTFRMLWPPENHRELSSNDRSCVLEVSVGTHRLLITGDVSRAVERALLLETRTPVTVLVVGHHGSHSSSGPQFVQTLAPRHAVFSAGRDNTFGHPAGEVVRRFRRADSCLWNTAQDGALTLWLGKDAPGKIVVERPAGWRHAGVEGDCLALESPG